MAINSGNAGCNGEAKTSFDYRMYVSDTEEFMKLWSDRERPDTWRVDTLSADELKKNMKKRSMDLRCGMTSLSMKWLALQN